MKNPPTDMTLLEQHIFQQNQRIIELSRNLKEFCDSGQYAIDNAERKSGERKALVQWSIVGVVICALLFGGTGYLLRFASEQVNLNTAREKVIAANERADAAEASQAAASGDAAKVLTAEIQKIEAASGWAGTPAGRLAKQFFDVGGGEVAAKCKADTWDIVKNKDGKWCVPNRRDFFGGDSQKFGWKIP